MVKTEESYANSKTPEILLPTSHDWSVKTSWLLKKKTLKVVQLKRNEPTMSALDGQLTYTGTCPGKGISLANSGGALGIGISETSEKKKTRSIPGEEKQELTSRCTLFAKNIYRRMQHHV